MFVFVWWSRVVCLRFHQEWFLLPMQAVDVRRKINDAEPTKPTHVENLSSALDRESLPRSPNDVGPPPRAQQHSPVRRPSNVYPGRLNNQQVAVEQRRLRDVFTLQQVFETFINFLSGEGELLVFKRIGLLQAAVKEKRFCIVLDLKWNQCLETLCVNPASCCKVKGTKSFIFFNIW